MNKVLLITINELKKDTSIGGNVDEDKLKQFVELTQDLEVQKYLGTKLYEALLASVEASTLSSDETTLIRKIKPFLIHSTAAEVIPFLVYNIANGGMFKGTASNGKDVDTKEIEYIANKHQKIADYYADRLIDYLCNNTDKHPLYTSAQDNDDISPSDDINSTGWTL